MVKRNQSSLACAAASDSIVGASWTDEIEAVMYSKLFKCILAGQSACMYLHVVLL
jgi:hypothetical protein